MKNYIIIFCSIISCLVIISCKKNEAACAYCSEEEPSGFMVGTMASDINTVPKNQVATLYKTLYNAIAPVGNNWNDPSAAPNRVQSIFPSGWTSDKIGEIFGIALDHDKGIYLSATDVYKFDGLQILPYNGAAGISSGSGPAGAAAIYYTNYTSINTTTALVTTLNSSSANTVGSNQIPSTGFTTSPGNSIGNIAFDYKNNQLFATNLEDGKIYRIDPLTGKVKSTLDPFNPDNGIAGIAPIGEQLWGIGVYTFNGITKVYFALTTLPHITNSLAPGGVEIWSVELNATGEFNATAGSGGAYNATVASGLIKKEISLTQGTQTKVTDIAFSNSGRMLLAERGNPHAAGVFEYVFNGTWNIGNNFYTGAALSSGPPANYLPGKNAAGGVDYSNREQKSGFACSDIVWATGNYMPTILLTGPYPNFVYGAQGMSSAGNNVLPSINQKNDLYIDYNCTGWPHTFSPGISSVKNKIGDVEFFDQTCNCK
ncbi:hypothetical protein [Pedobacter nototheniae]|uniref:hypothetical protein n=1 Tax=Pedobacter nototheniae TaxID=2488994 RepID=UPI00103C22DA|nr:hypothetical protein [Pedobacter nototheniae]